MTNPVRFAVAALLLALVGTLASPLGGPAHAISEADKAYAAKAFKVTNNVRDNRNRVKLGKNACLQTFARTHAKKLADRNIKQLKQSDHQALKPILDECNLDLVGENLALGYPNGRAVVKKGWMKSPGHRANILERRYRLLALAARQTDDGLWVAVQLFGRKA